MDTGPFAPLITRLTTSRTRRGALGFLAALGGVTAPWRDDPAAGKRKKRKKGKKKKKTPVCTPDSQAATCAGRCGFWTNNCGQSVGCLACSGSLQCLSNGSCAEQCVPPPGGTICPDGCSCSHETAEGTHNCILSLVTGPQKPCQSTADCPPGFQCSPNNEVLVCLPLCAA